MREPAIRVRASLRDPPSLVFAAVQPVLFVLLYRHASDGAAWLGVPLIVAASTYFRLRLTGPSRLDRNGEPST